MNSRKHISKRLNKNFLLCLCLIAMAIFLTSPIVFAMGGGGGGGGGGGAAGGSVGAFGAMSSFGFGNTGLMAGYGGGLMAGYGGGLMAGYGGGLMAGYGGGLMTGYGGGLMAGYGPMAGYGSTSAVNTAAMLGAYGGAGYGAASMGAGIMNQSSIMNQAGNAWMSQSGNMYGNTYGNMYVDDDVDSSTRYMGGNMISGGGMGSGGNGYMWGTDPTMVPVGNAAANYGMLPNAINSQGISGYMTGMGTGAGSFNATGNVAAGFWGPTLGGAPTFVPVMNQYQYNMPW